MFSQYATTGTGRLSAFYRLATIARRIRKKKSHRIVTKHIGSDQWHSSDLAFGPVFTGRRHSCTESTRLGDTARRAWRPRIASRCTHVARGRGHASEKGLSNSHEALWTLQLDKFHLCLLCAVYRWAVCRTLLAACYRNICHRHDHPAQCYPTSASPNTMNRAIWCVKCGPKRTRQIRRIRCAPTWTSATTAWIRTTTDRSSKMCSCRRACFRRHTCERVAREPLAVRSRMATVWTNGIRCRADRWSDLVVDRDACQCGVKWHRSRFRIRFVAHKAVKWYALGVDLR